MTKSELIDQVAERANLSKKDAGAAVNALLDTVQNALVSGESVQITGFGTFEVRQRAAREGVKPGTSEKIKIAASKAPAFKAGKSLKDAVNK
jgi:DNA-binding protein HU-beta